MKLPFAITRKSVLILVIVCICGVVHYETTPPRQLYPDTLNMIEAGGLTDATIVYRIVEQELAFHKSKRLLVEGKIFDYKNIFVIPERIPKTRKKNGSASLILFKHGMITGNRTMESRGKTTGF